MKLLIVGGTGVLSSEVTKEAIKQGVAVTIINRGNSSAPINDEVKVFTANINDKNKVLSLLDGEMFDAVIDFICYNKKQIEYSFNLFKDFVKQYVFISSTAVYNYEKCSNCDEEAPKGMEIWNYSVDKVACENYLEKIAKEANKNYTIIRPAVTYGNTRIPYGIMPSYGYHGTMIKRIENGKPIITWDQAKNRCNIFRTEDFAVGLVGLIGNSKAYGEAFNICGDETPSWLEVLDAISNSMRIPVKTFDLTSIEYAKEMPNKKGEIVGGRAVDAITSNNKIKTVVPSFNQNICLQEGIDKTIAHYKSNNYLKGIDYAFDADTDRIILKYAKSRGFSISDMNLGFKDYIGTASFKDKYTYYLNFNREKDHVKILLKLQMQFRRFLRKIKAIF